MDTLEDMLCDPAKSWLQSPYKFLLVILEKEIVDVRVPVQVCQQLARCCTVF